MRWPLWCLVVLLEIGILSLSSLNPSTKTTEGHLMDPNSGSGQLAAGIEHPHPGILPILSIGSGIQLSVPTGMLRLSNAGFLPLFSSSSISIIDLATLSVIDLATLDRPPPGSS